MTVGSLTGDESEGEQREELGQADHPDGESGLRDGHGPSSDLVHIPRDHDRLRTGGQGAEKASSQKQCIGTAGQQRRRIVGRIKPLSGCGHSVFRLSTSTSRVSPTIELLGRMVITKIFHDRLTWSEGQTAHGNRLWRCLNRGHGSHSNARARPTVGAFRFSARTSTEFVATDSVPQPERAPNSTITSHAWSNSANMTLKRMSRHFRIRALRRRLSDLTSNP